MKRVLAASAVLVIIALALLLAAGVDDVDLPFASDDSADPAQDPERTPNTPTSQPEDESGAATFDPDPLIDQPAPPATARPATVRRLADGDSFDIEWSDTGERDEVRLFGLNAPERDACYGQAAGDILQALTEDAELTIETIERDEFGRVLANVWVNDLFLNATLVEMGAALALSDGGAHAGLIVDAQASAKASAAGLWDPNFCGADLAIEVRIARIEADAPGRDNENKNGEWIEIQNDGATAADLTDWSIRDESTRHRYSFPDSFFLDAGASVRVFSGCGSDTDRELYWCDADPVWNNGGDTGFLVDAEGRFVDTRSY